LIDIGLSVLTGGLISAFFFKFYTIFDRFRFRKEIRFVIPALLGGLAAVLITLGLQWGMSQIEEIASIMYSGHNRSIYISPFVEEVAKGLVTVAAIKLLKSEEILDSLFLAIAVGIGFSFFENLLFASITGVPASAVARMIERSLVITPMHAIQNFLFILIWLLLGRMVKNKFLLFLLALPFPGISHAVWNYIALETGANLVNLTVMILVSRAIVFAIRVEKEDYIINLLEAEYEENRLDTKGKKNDGEPATEPAYPTADNKEPTELKELNRASSEWIYSFIFEKLHLTRFVKSEKNGLQNFFDK